MKYAIASLLTLSASFLGISAAQAGELDYPPPLEVTSHLTRADVVQQLHAAQAAGKVFPGELAPAGYYDDAPATSLIRTQVVQERDQARVQGLIGRGNLDYPPATHG